MKIGIATSLFFFLAILNPLHSSAQEMSEGLETLVTWMTGAFDSADQAKSDTSYLNITMKATRIWDDKPNGAWIYLEQAAAEAPDKPYRQRIYFLSELEEDSYTSDIYNIKDETALVGAWKDPSKFDNLTPFDLQNKQGCTVFLFYDGFQFSGSTNEKTCKSNFQGATYTASDVILTASELRSWDRGHNDAEEQVWGAKDGPYIFKKR